jgi:hypothetical protein
MPPRFHAGRAFHHGRARHVACAGGALVVLAMGGEARAEEAPVPVPAADDNLFVLGPSLATAPGEGQRSGFLGGVDATLTVSFGWMSLGARARPGERWNVYPYAEIGVWFVVNVGVGYSLGVGPDIPLHNWHWFVGLPVPIGALGDADIPMFFVEPYYRPTMSLADPTHRSTLHELGLLVKWAWPIGGES